MGNSWPFQMHDALWKSFDAKHDDTVEIGSRVITIKYEDTPYANRSRADAYGLRWETQNMRKLTSQNTQRMMKDPSLRYTWGFRHGREGIQWKMKITEQDVPSGRRYVLTSLATNPNTVVDSKIIPRDMESDEGQAARKTTT